ncbi:MAG: ABC transporter permease subunit [Kineosporiaceae bacterium]|nr:ABC transporter permease subunit [Aeromicrobium sp.]
MSFFNDWGSWLPTLLTGLWASARVAGLSLLLGLPAGLLLALGSGAKSLSVRWTVIGLVELGRGMPALVMLQIVYFGLPNAGLTLSALLSSAFAFALTTAAYTSEILRGGLQAVPAGEVEAAEALGLARRDTLRFIVIPQGIRIAIPPLMGFAILIFQVTSLAYTIALPELTSQAYSIGSSSFRYTSVFTLAALLYLAVTIPTSFLTERIEIRLARHL